MIETYIKMEKLKEFYDKNKNVVLIGGAAVVALLIWLKVRGK
jgi:hypothetical protein